MKDDAALFSRDFMENCRLKDELRRMQAELERSRREIEVLRTSKVDPVCSSVSDGESLGYKLCCSGSPPPFSRRDDVPSIESSLGSREQEKQLSYISRGPNEIQTFTTSRGNLVKIEELPDDADLGEEEGGNGFILAEVPPLTGGGLSAGATAGAVEEGGTEGGGASRVLDELNSLAREFPSCVQYLKREFDNRRLLTETGRSINEERLKGIMKRVARKSGNPDVKLMALYIGAKLGGEETSGPSRIIPTDLQPLEGSDKEQDSLLRSCSCSMSNSMKCTCHQRGKNHNPLQPSLASRKSTVIRRTWGEVVVTPQQVCEQVERMGGMEAVDGRQGTKGKGWKGVATELGIDTEKYRDAGYQMRKIYYMETSGFDTRRKRRK